MWPKLHQDIQEIESDIFQHQKHFDCKMGGSCAAPNCRTGGRTRKGWKHSIRNLPVTPGNQVTLHRIPKDPERRAAWLRAIPRDQWTPSRNSFICSLHFIDTDFELNSQDQKRSRRKKSLEMKMGQSASENSAV
ncbi:hypothetical protein TCAL_16514 [Tigriopus californicus]|uniref:THAP-type domain-containing protein n=1 Tax=Tigriopus californicus TaxID=6832 RepID=A0A553NS97_TIGCA|nr:hypothetical protein TCAL_16514 [Tigriopus californicus]